MIQDKPVYYRSRQNGHSGQEMKARRLSDGEPSASSINPNLVKAADRQAKKGNGQAARAALVKLGYVYFDGNTPDNATCSVIVPEKQWPRFRRDVYVGIRDPEEDLEFLGRVVAGPFHKPRKEASKKSEAAGAKQGYHVYGTVEILGQLINGDRVVPTATRPRPYSEIFIFPDHRLKQFLRINGDFYLGALSGHKTAKVHADSRNHNFLPRNVGIFGTVGSGKSNTAQVLTEEALQAGWAVVLIDVEGEYVRMNEQNSDPRLIGMLNQDYHLQPTGVKDFRVYVPSSGKSAAEVSIPFKVPISALYEEVIGDILEFTEAETRVYSMVTAQATRLHSADAPSPYADNQPQRPFTLQHLTDGLMESSGMGGNRTVRLLPMAHENDVATAGMLRSKLLHLERSNMLDGKETATIRELPVPELLVGGRLSVLDVSETDDRSRNLAIAYILQELFKQVITTPVGTPMASGKPRPPLLVVIEEVHTFVSRAAAPKMRAVLDSLQIISRRGRKRWMALGLVSQQPNHVPKEIFELTNTRFIHQIKSPNNLEPVKKSTAGVDEKLWGSIPAMGPGQCLLAGSVFKNPLFLNVRPSQSLRLHVS